MSWAAERIRALLHDRRLRGVEGCRTFSRNELPRLLLVTAFRQRCGLLNPLSDAYGVHLHDYLLDDLPKGTSGVAIRRLARTGELMSEEETWKLEVD